MYPCISRSLQLTWGERRLGNFRRSKVGLFICLLKRHIACWRQSLSMWLPVSFWSEQKQQTKGLFGCLWIYIMNMLNIFCKLLKDPKKLIISCLWAGAVQSCSSFRRLQLPFFPKLSARHAFSFQMSTFWKHFFLALIFSIKIDSDRRLDVCISLFALRALRETTALDLAYKTLDIDVIDDPRLGGFQSPLMNIKIGSTTMPSKPLNFRCQFPILCDRI